MRQKLITAGIMLVGSIAWYTILQDIPGPKQWDISTIATVVGSLSSVGMFLTGVIFYTHQLEVQKQKTKMYNRLNRIIEFNTTVYNAMIDDNIENDEVIKTVNRMHDVVTKYKKVINESGFFTVDEMLNIDKLIRESPY